MQPEAEVTRVSVGDSGEVAVSGSATPEHDHYRALMVAVWVVGKVNGGFAGDWVEDEPLRGWGRVAGALFLLGCVVLVIVALLRP